jgi:hypothetical protein
MSYGRASIKAELCPQLRDQVISLRLERIQRSARVLSVRTGAIGQIGLKHIYPIALFALSADIKGHGFRTPRPR